MFRSGTYWACVAHIAVDTTSGVIKVEKITVAVDPGIVVNPAQLRRQVEGGAVMGVSMALLEELSFEGPEMKKKKVSVDAAYVRKQLVDIVKDQDLSRYIL